MKTITIATALLLTITGAHAESMSSINTTIARGVSRGIIYDQNCESVPKAAMRALDQMIRRLPARQAKAAALEAVAEYKRMGLSEFCEYMKPRIEQLIDSLE